MRISDWSSDVCSSDLTQAGRLQRPPQPALRLQPLRVAGGGLVMGHGLVDCVCRNRKLAGEHRQEALAAFRVLLQVDAAESGPPPARRDPESGKTACRERGC